MRDSGESCDLVTSVLRLFVAILGGLPGIIVHRALGRWMPWMCRNHVHVTAENLSPAVAIEDEWFQSKSQLEHPNLHA